MRPLAVFPEGFGFDPSMSAGPAIFTRRPANSRPLASAITGTKRAALKPSRRPSAELANDHDFDGSSRLDGRPELSVDEAPLDVVRIEPLISQTTMHVALAPPSLSEHPLADADARTRFDPARLPAAGFSTSVEETILPASRQPQSVMVTAALLGIALAALGYLIDFH